MSHSNAKHTTPAATAGPRFVTGSLLRHIGVMAGTGAIGLVAIFAVDLVNLLYISMLGEQAIAAAVGFAGVVGFFHLSVFIGMLIGIAAVVSRAIGAQRMAEAREAFEWAAGFSENAVERAFLLGRVAECGKALRAARSPES